MRTIIWDLTDFGPFCQRVGELNIVDPVVDDDDLVGRGKQFVDLLLQQQPQMLNKGMCLVGSDETGTIRFVSPIDTVH